MPGQIRYISVCLILLILLLFPTAANATWPGWEQYFEFGAGMDYLRGDNKSYKTDNFGALFSLTAGMTLLYFSIQITQEAGFITLNPTAEFLQEGKSKQKASFKGATLLLTRLRYPVGFGGDRYNVKDYAFGPFTDIGIGAEYLDISYYDRQHDFTSWFAFRIGLGFEFFLIEEKKDSRFALMLDYTLGLSHNYFSDRIYSHFIAVKLVIGRARQLL